jgi:hypothetical protein
MLGAGGEGQDYFWKQARHASHTESTSCITFTKEGREKENAFCITTTAASSSGREMG